MGKVYVVIIIGSHAGDCYDCWWNMEDEWVLGVFSTKESAELHISIEKESIAKKDDDDYYYNYYDDIDFKIEEFDLTY